MGLALLALALNYLALDESDTWIVRSFSRQVLQQLPADATILAEWSSASPMEYVQLIEHHRQDVTVINLSFFLLGQRDALQRRLSHEAINPAIEEALLHLVDTQLEEHPVYAFGWDPILATQYEFWPAGRRIYRLVPKGVREYGRPRCRWLRCRP
jgi:hypothetical protein